MNIILKTIEKYTSLTIQQPKKRGIETGPSLVFIYSVHFLNNVLNNLVKDLGKNYFHHLSQEFNANVLDLLKKFFFSL